MNENMKALIEKAQADKELRAKFAKITDLEEAYKLASSVQGGFTREEFVAEMKKIREAFMGDLTGDDINQVSDLSDDDLARVAGGVQRR